MNNPKRKSWSSSLKKQKVNWKIFYGKKWKRIRNDLEYLSEIERFLDVKKEGEMEDLFSRKQQTYNIF